MKNAMYKVSASFAFLFYLVGGNFKKLCIAHLNILNDVAILSFMASLSLSRR